jgi:hypothetical protein
MEIALGVRNETTFRVGVRAGAGVGDGEEGGSAPGRDCGKEFVSTNCGRETSFWTSGNANLFVAFISTPEMLPYCSAEPSQNSL